MTKKQRIKICDDLRKQLLIIHNGYLDMIAIKLTIRKEARIKPNSRIGKIYKASSIGRLPVVEIVKALNELYELEMKELK